MQQHSCPRMLCHEPWWWKSRTPELWKESKRYSLYTMVETSAKQRWNIIEGRNTSVTSTYAWSQDLMKNMGLRETKIYIAWHVMYKLMINKHQNICVRVYWNAVNAPGWKLSWWSNNAESMEECEGLVKKGVICNCSDFFCMSLCTFLHGAMTASSTYLKHMAEIRSTYKTLVRKPQMTPRHKWEYTIKINVSETECKRVGWI